jgi:hypothetical protein
MSEELKAKIEKAWDELNALCQGKKFRMCIPVQPDDTDRVIGEGLRAGMDALEEIKHLRVGFAKLTADNKQLAEALRQVRIENHRECEDGWYSCQKHEGYFGEEDRTECDCGKDENNAVIDAALAAHETGMETK